MDAQSARESEKRKRKQRTGVDTPGPVERFRLRTLIVGVSLVALAFAILKLAASNESTLAFLIVVATCIMPMVSYEVASRYKDKPTRWMVGLIFVPGIFILAIIVFSVLALAMMRAA